MIPLEGTLLPLDGVLFAVHRGRGRPPVPREIVTKILSLRGQRVKVPISEIALMVGKSERAVESIIYREARRVREAVAPPFSLEGRPVISGELTPERRVEVYV
jgi:hypothetical protein